MKNLTTKEKELLKKFEGRGKFNNSSVISFTLHSNVISGFSIISNLLKNENNLFIFSILKEDGVPPPIYIVLIGSFS